MKSIKAMTMGELAAYVCSHLKNNAIDVTLTGGGCVSIYTDGAFVSYDLDFIETLTTGRKKLKTVLAEIGFNEHNRYFQHPETEFFLEFPSGPMAVGNEPPTSVVEMTFETGQLRILSATDCIKDRLAAFFHWNDLQCLEQALQVAAHHEVDLTEVQRWALKEGHEGKFDEFKRRLSRKG